jgi:ribosomal protein RSM22 (predicted rRNA methylase)
VSSDYHRDLDRWIPRLERASGGRVDVKAVAQAVRTLSLGLTRDRTLAGARYMDDPRLLGAYLLFYWVVSYAQARSVLNELPSRPRSVLDLGSGPGPVAFAALDAGAADVTIADRSRRALDLATKLATDAEEGIATREWSPERPLPDGEFDLITMGHLLNELDASKRVPLVEAALAKLRPRGSVLILEPALKETSRGLLQVRDALVAKGYAVRAPCLWRGACPALVKESDWCHAERSWRMPSLVEQIARAASLHKEALKMSYLVLAPKGEAWREPPPGRVFRIVSEPLQGKGRARYMGCGPEGRIGLALQHRHVGPSNEAFMKLDRGDVIEITTTQEKGDGLALDDSSVVKVIAPAGQSIA